MSDNASGSGACAEQPNPEALPMQSKRGYCGCCQELYTSLEQHLQSARHRQFAGESRNPVAVKSLMDRFLQDVIQYHPSHYKDNRPTYVDLPLISPPHVPKKELADIHSYQDDKETIGTREDLPSSDNESVRSAGVRDGKDAAGCRRGEGRQAPSVPGGDPARTEEPASPSYRESCRTAFLAASEGILSRGQVDKQGHRVALGVYKPTARRRPKDCQQPKATSSRASEEPTAANLPNVSSLKFSTLHINSPGPPLAQLCDPAGPSSPGGEREPPGRRAGEGTAPLGEAEDLVSETIETVIRKYCHGQAPGPRDGGEAAPCGGRTGPKWASGPRRRAPRLEKVLSLSLSCERRGSAASISSLGSRLGCLRSAGGSSSEWSAPLKGGCRPAANAPQPVTDARISLEDQGYEARLSTVLRSQAGAGEPAADQEPRPAPAETPPRLPPSFAGMTWSEVMAEDDLRVEALVKEFKEGRYLCYFDGETSARRKRRRQRAPAGGATQPLAPAQGGEQPARKGDHRRCSASRCQVVKVSRGTQTSEAGYPAARRRARRAQREAENAWSGPGQPESPGPRSPRLPRSYSRIMSPVQPRTLVYVLSSPVFGPAAEQGCRTWPDGGSAAKVKYKKSPLRFYDPAANRIVRAPPTSLASPHHVRQLFRSLSPDINAGRPGEEQRAKWSRGPLRPAADAATDCAGGSRADGAQLPLAGPLRRASAGTLFGRLHVYPGPRSRRLPDKGTAEPARCSGREPPGYNLRGASSASAPGPPRLRSALRRPAGSSGEKVLRREAGRGEEAGGEQSAHRRGRRQGSRRRK